MSAQSQSSPCTSSGSCKRNNGRSCIKVSLALGGGRDRKGGRGGRVTFAASRVAVGGVRDHGAGGRRGCQLKAGAVFSQVVGKWWARACVWAAADRGGGGGLAGVWWCRCVGG